MLSNDEDTLLQVVVVILRPLLKALNQKKLGKNLKFLKFYIISSSDVIYVFQGRTYVACIYSEN